MKRVVITGIGAVTPIGNNANDFWNNALDGKCGIDFITQYDASEDKVKVAAEVKDFDLAEVITAKDAKRMSRFTQLGMVAADEAIKDSDIIGNVSDERLGVSIGCGIGGIGDYEEGTLKAYDGKRNRISPFLVPMMIPNILGGQVAIKYRAKGFANCTVTACSSGAYAIIDSFYAIKRGEVDAVIAGGAESVVTPVTINGFANMTALSTKNDPKASSIPFDKNRDGFVMGEGAGILILEEYEHAKARGAKIYAEVKGVGVSCDAYHITAPDPSGAGIIESMKKAIKSAEIDKSEINYINAHGTSTPANDRTETIGIKELFGEDAYKLSINSTKSLIGHTLGAAGSIEAIVCTLSIQNNKIHPTAGYSEKDEELDLDYTPNKAKDLEINYALSNSLGFGGHNSSILFSKI